MSRALTIAIVRTKFHAESTGGRVFEEEVLTAALGTSTPHKFVIYPRFPTDLAMVKERGIAHRVSFVPELRKPLLPKRVVRRATRTLLRRQKPTPAFELTNALRKKGAECAWLLGGALTALDMPYAATIWDLQHRVQPWFPEVSARGEWDERERLNRDLVGRAASLIVGTAEGARQIRQAYGDPSGSLTVVPLPTPSFAIEAGIRPRGPRPADLPAHYLFYPAQFWPHKNHVTLVRMLLALGEQEGTTQLLLVGNDRGNQKHVMDTAQALGVAHRVHLMPFVPQERLVTLYRHADALVFPSMFGPDNLPPLEAMALGCPVIAADIPGATEQLGDCAQLVDPLDAESYAAAVRSLHAEPMRIDAMVARARARARSWTSAQYVAAILDVFSNRIGPMRDLWP